MRSTRSVRIGAAGVLAAVLGILALAGGGGGASPSVARSPGTSARRGAPPPPLRPRPAVRSPAAASPGAGLADGVVPDGATVFDDGYPAVARLDPALLRALRRAAADAARDGVTFRVDSGWRSPRYQEQLLREAVARYGSDHEAARWVATPETSAHVSGDAVDIGPARADAWLADRGAAHGLCQIYRNEAWHYELRPGAADRGCPRMYADPTHDPRMQR